MGPPLPTKRSGNSLSGKTRTRRKKCGAPSDRKTVLTGKIRKALFCIIGKKVSSVTVGSSRKKVPITLILTKTHHTLTFAWITSVFSNMRAFTSPYMKKYPKVSNLASWSENCKWYSSLPLGAVLSPFCESV
jgi:hypothetical protein